MTTVHPLRGGRAWYDDMTPPVQVRDRLVPETIFVDLYGDGEQPSLQMKIEVRQSIPVCTELRLTARPADATFSEPTCGRCASTAGSSRWSPCVRMSSSSRVVSSLSRHRRGRPGERASGQAHPLRGRPKVPPERLHEVAELYGRHTPDGQPLLVVADVLGVSARTAARYVEKCRSDGLLPPREKASAK